jgi:protein-tyrosine phosphatase
MISQITDNIFLGNYLDALKTYVDYDAILNMASEVTYNDNPKSYLQINILDGFAFSNKIINQCMDFLKEHDDIGHKILIHCVGGISRSPGILICYLCIKNNWTIADSYQYIFKKRDIIDPAAAIIISIRDYLENKCPTN